MLKFFQQCKTKQEAKKLFRTLAKQFHPDAEHGDNDKMVSIIAEYEKVMKSLPSVSSDNNEQTEQTDEQFNIHVSQEMQEILDNISHLPIDIEIIGTWIWVSGNTFAYKSYLTAYNFLWCPTKKMYQWHIDRKKGYHGKPQDIEKIRFNYGTTKVNNSQRQAII